MYLYVTPTFFSRVINICNIQTFLSKAAAFQNVCIKRLTLTQLCYAGNSLGFNGRTDTDKESASLTKLTISCNDRTTQAAKDLMRALVQPSAQIGIRSEIKLCCSRFHPPGKLKTASLGSSCLMVLREKFFPTFSLCIVAQSWVSWWVKLVSWNICLFSCTLGSFVLRRGCQ